jgi:hypothetical protein
MGDLMRDLTAPHVCCFCGEAISKKDDQEAVELAVRNLWSKGHDDPVQALFAPSECATSRLHQSVPFLPAALLRE